MSDARTPRKSKASPRSQSPAPESGAKSPAPESGAKSPAPESAATSEPDIAILGGPTEDGQGARLIRVRDGTISAGEIRPVREGEPVTHRELVRLHPMDEDQRVCRVETLHAPAELAGDSPRSRPARVSNARYRKNWDAIFGGSKVRNKRDYSVN